MFNLILKLYSCNCEGFLIVYIELFTLYCVIISFGRHIALYDDILVVKGFKLCTALVQQQRHISSNFFLQSHKTRNYPNNQIKDIVWVCNSKAYVNKSSNTTYRTGFPCMFCFLVALAANLPLLSNWLRTSVPIIQHV